MGERIVFTIAAAAAIAFAILVITFKEPFRATVSLIGTLLVDRGAVRAARRRPSWRPSR